MRHVRTLLVIAFGLTTLTHATAQEGAASAPATKPAVETAPTSRPAEVRIRHPRIGIKVDAAALDHQKIARVEAVVAGSAAERAGIKVGDVIVKAGGEEIRDDKGYREMMGRRRPGESVTMLVRRGAEEVELSVVVPDKQTRPEPDAITVQHVLVSVGDKSAKKRTVEEARTLANEILVKAKNGADFAELVKLYSEDPGSVRNDPPGSYVLANDGKPKPTPAAIDRQTFIAGFTAVAFGLDVGDVAMSPYDADLSYFGFHIIKRIK